MGDKSFDYTNGRLTVRSTTGAPAEMTRADFIDAALIAGQVPDIRIKVPDMEKPAVALKVNEGDEYMMTTYNGSDSSIANQFPVKTGEALAVRLDPHTKQPMLNDNGDIDQWRVKADEIDQLYEMTGEELEGHGMMAAGKNKAYVLDFENGIDIEKPEWNSMQDLPDGCLLLKQVGGESVYGCDKPGMTMFSERDATEKQMLDEMYDRLDDPEFKDLWEQTPSDVKELHGGDFNSYRSAVYGELEHAARYSGLATGSEAMKWGGAMSQDEMERWDGDIDR